jgi:cobalamin synthase
VRDRDEWMRRLGPLFPAMIAVRRTTIVRAPRGLGAIADDLARSAPWMVALGAVTGFVGYATAWLAARWGAQPLLAAALAIAGALIAGGAVIESEAARWAERRAGKSAPVVSAATALIRFGALAQIPAGKWLAALIVSELIARWAALLLQRLGDPILDDAERPGLAVGEVSWGVVGAITAAVVAIAAALYGGAGVAAVAAAGAAAFALGLEAQRRDGQPGGDALAAAAAIGGAIALCAAAWAAPLAVAWRP